jgi:two-component system, OmpR family, alkaline phosphatase synthesis response regulator PhoP
MAPTSVLLVEDDDAARSLFEDALQMAGFSVRSLSRAAGAFDALRREIPDVILLDLGMPHGTLQGMEMLAQLREVAAWRDIPVVILSGFGEVVNRDVTRRLGVAAILGKPLDTAYLEQTIRQVVPRNKS